MNSGNLYKPQALQLADKWREMFNPMERLTLRGIVNWLYLQQLGASSDITWLYSFLERRNATLMACVQRRTAAMEKLEWDIKVLPEDQLPKGATKTMADNQRQILFDAYRRIDNLRDAFNWMELGCFRGFAHLEKHYDADGEVFHLEPVPQWNWARAGQTGIWCYNQRALSIFAPTPPATNPQLTVIDESDFIIREVANPIDEAIVGGIYRAILAQKDWDAFLTSFGIPSVFVELPPNAPLDENGTVKSEYQKQAEGVVSNSRGVTPSGSKVTAFDASGRGRNPFLEHMKYQDEKIVLAATGGKLTMLAESGSGTLAGSAHKDTFDGLAEASAMTISEIFNAQFDRFILEEKCPGQPVLARFVLEGKELTDATAVVADVMSLANAGFEVDPDQIEQKTGYRVSLREPVSKTADRAAAGDSTIEPSTVGNRIRRMLSHILPNFLGNRTAENKDAVFAQALRRFRPAQAAMLRPLLLELKTAMAGDDAGLKNRIGKIAEKIPSLLKDINVDPATAKIITDGLVAEYFNTRQTTKGKNK